MTGWVRMIELVRMTGLAWMTKTCHSYSLLILSFVPILEKPSSMLFIICQNKSLFALKTEILVANHEQILDFNFSSVLNFFLFLSCFKLFFSSRKNGFVNFVILRTNFLATPIFQTPIIFLTFLISLFSCYWSFETCFAKNLQRMKILAKIHSNSVPGLNHCEISITNVYHTWNTFIFLQNIGEYAIRLQYALNC